MVHQNTTTEGDVHHVIETFFSSYPSFSVEKNTVLLHSHQPADTIFFLREGIVKQTVVTSKGQQLTLNLYKKGSFFPLMEVLTGIPNRYTFTSLTGCNGFKAPAAKVRQFIQETPAVSIDLNDRLLRGLHGMLERCEKLMEKDAGALILQTFLTLNEREITPLPLTHQEIADQTGLSRETVTRELALLHQEGLLSIQGHVVSLVQ